MRSGNADDAPRRTGGSDTRTATIVIVATIANTNAHALLPIRMRAATAGTCSGIAHRPRSTSRVPRRTATTAIRTRIRTAIDGPAMLLLTVALVSDSARPWMTPRSDSKRDTNPRMTGNRRQ